MCLCLSFLPSSFRVVFADLINVFYYFFLALFHEQMLHCFVADEYTKRKTLFTQMLIIFNDTAAFMTFILVMAVLFFLYHTNCDVSVAIS